MLCLVGGCSLVGVIGNAFGPSPVPAQYVPTQDPMLVVVENFQNPSLTSVDANRLEMRIYDDLKAHQVCPLIDPAILQDIREQHRADYQRISVQALGKLAGAKQVLYVSIIESVVNNNSADLLKGTLSLRVKVVDAQTGDMLWPQGASDGYPLSFTTPNLRSEPGVDEDTIKDRLLAGTSLSVSRLFYEFKP